MIFTIVFALGLLIPVLIITKILMPIEIASVIIVFIFLAGEIIAGYTPRPHVEFWLW